MFIKETTLATITNNLRCFRHIFLFNDAILICLPSTILPPKKPSYDFELFIQIQTINLVSPIPNEDFNLIKGSNYEGKIFFFFIFFIEKKNEETKNKRIKIKNKKIKNRSKCCNGKNSKI